MHTQQKPSSISYEPMLMMSPEECQSANEYTYSRFHIDNYLRHEITSDEDTIARMNQCVQDLSEWVQQDFYASKLKRLLPFRSYTEEQWDELVIQMTIGVAYCQSPELFTSITSQLASRLKMGDQKAAITTIAEMIIPLAHNDLIDIILMPSKGEGEQFNSESYGIKARFPLSEEVVSYVIRSAHLPPMVCPPQIIKTNKQSGYLTHNSTKVLNNRTDEPIALDVINTQNQMALHINIEFLLNVDNISHKPLDTPAKLQAFNDFKTLANEFYLLLHSQSQANIDVPGAIYFDHNLDSRGRMYCYGYHINYQGRPYDKAAIELATPEFVPVPEKYRR